MAGGVLVRRRDYKLAPVELPCGPGCRLVVALTADSWQAVYYQAQFAGDLIGRRFAIEKRVLLDALRVLFAEAGEPFDADALVAYIASSSWGAGLPYLSARREPVAMPQDERLAELHGWTPDEPKPAAGDPGDELGGSGVLFH